MNLLKTLFLIISSLSLLTLFSDGEKKIKDVENGVYTGGKFRVFGFIIFVTVEEDCVHTEIYQEVQSQIILVYSEAGIIDTSNGMNQQWCYKSKNLTILPYKKGICLDYFGPSGIRNSSFKKVKLKKNKQMVKNIETYKNRAYVFDDSKNYHVIYSESTYKYDCSRCMQRIFSHPNIDKLEKTLNFKDFVIKYKVLKDSLIMECQAKCKDKE